MISTSVCIAPPARVSLRPRYALSIQYRHGVGWRNACCGSRNQEDPQMPKQFRGSYTVSITPFTEDGKKIDVPAWKRFLDWQIKLGIPGIIVLGTTGEFLTVS